MPKPTFVEDPLIHDVIECLLAGHKQWRPDLDYPESHSDMKAAAMNLLIMFDVRRRPTPRSLSMPCAACGGIGEFVHRDSTPTFRKTETCPHCKGRGKVPYG